VVQTVPGMSVRTSYLFGILTRCCNFNCKGVLEGNVDKIKWPYVSFVANKILEARHAVWLGEDERDFASAVIVTRELV
jgi:hypothetical protein